jgi:hypothetical protein
MLPRRWSGPGQWGDASLVYCTDPGDCLTGNDTGRIATGTAIARAWPYAPHVRSSTRSQFSYATLRSVASS